MKKFIKFPKIKMTKILHIVSRDLNLSNKFRGCFE